MPESQGSTLWQQYQRLAEAEKDAIVFMRLGDFYEAFGDNAKLVSEQLNLTITARDMGLEQRMPMVGVPAHTLNGYVSALVEKGHRVAISENRQVISERMGENKMDENTFLSSDKDMYAIYQIPSGNDALRDYRFASIAELNSRGLSVQRENYEYVYSSYLGSLSNINDTDRLISTISQYFNIGTPPDGYTGRSLSVGDVIVLRQEGETTAYFSDSVKYVLLQNFLDKEMQRQSMEITLRKDMHGGYIGTTQDGKNEVFISSMGTGTGQFSLSISGVTVAPRTSFEQCMAFLEERNIKHVSSSELFEDYNRGQSTKGASSIPDNTIAESNYVQGNEEKSAKDKLFEQLNDGVKSILNSDEFKNYLKTSSRFFYNGYSLRNTLLIHMQKPDASYVNGYEAWKEYGRTVKQGAKGAQIIIPVYAAEKEKGGLYGQIKGGLKAELAKNPSAPHVSYRLGQSSFEFTQNRANGLIGLRKDGKDRGFFNSDTDLRKFIDTAILGKVPVYFNVGTVFDVKDVVIPEHLWVKKGFSKDEVVKDNKGNPIKNNRGQTKIINTPERQARFVEKMETELIAQDPEKMNRLFNTLATVCANKGFALEIRTPKNDKNLEGGTEGYFTSYENYSNPDVSDEIMDSLKKDCPNGVVVVNSELDVALRCSVLIHEIAHGDMHSKTNIEKIVSEMGVDKAEITRKLKETQAQAVSYAVASSFGIEDKNMSFDYLAHYASGVELQELNQSLNVIHKEVQALIKDIHVELDKAGYTPELVEKADTVLDADTIARVTENNLDYALEQEKFCNATLNEVAALYDNIKPMTYDEFEAYVFKGVPDNMQDSFAYDFFEDEGNISQYEEYLEMHSEKYGVLYSIVDNAKINTDNRLENICVIKEGVAELKNLNTREAQNHCIDKIESAARSIAASAHAFENLRKSFLNVNEQVYGGLKVEFEKDPIPTLIKIGNDFPKLKELSKAQLSYIAASKFVANESAMLRNEANVSAFVDMVCDRANALPTCASRSGVFVEVSFCENFVDKPIFTNGTICHPKVAEDIFKQAEIQLQGIKKDYEGKGDYFPYVKCHVAVFDVAKSTAIETTIHIGDGEQQGFKDHLQKCFGGDDKGNLELLENFNKALKERGVKDKVYTPNFPEGDDPTDRAVAIDENTLSIDGFSKEVTTFKEAADKITSSTEGQSKSNSNRDDISN